MNKFAFLNMSSESVAEDFEPSSAAATMKAGKKRGRPLAGRMAIKYDADVRVHRWNELSSDIAQEAMQVFIMTSERTTCMICHTTKQFVKLSNTRMHAECDSHKDNEAKDASKSSEV